MYLPLFVGLSRVAVHRLRIPLWLAAPVVWTGLELARAHVMTGFMMASLAHTQARWPIVIQISNLAGEYGVDFVMMLVAAAVTDCGFLIADCRLQNRNPIRAFLPLLPAALILAATLIYGNQQLKATASPNQQSTINNQQSSSPRLALIQGNSAADWKSDLSKQQQIMSEYFQLSQQAAAAAKQGGRPIDLIVWPETMFRVPLRSAEPGYHVPPDADYTLDDLTSQGPRELANVVAALGAPILVGIDRIVHRADESDVDGYNSCVLVDRDGMILGTYDKFHLVMFGEYVPFSKWLPFLKHISSITGAAEAGTGPVALEIGGVRYAPSICYETVIPHVIRGQVATLDAAGQRPDVLVNLTNDAWYWGSSELDMHLACDVFRAVETRTPLVIAANGGISASIDAQGRIRARGPRQQPDVILADVKLNRGSPPTVYVRTGDWFAMTCLACCVILAVFGWNNWHRKTRRN